MLAIACLTIIVIIGMILKQNEIAAAAVGGIAGFISQKGLTNAKDSSAGGAATSSASASNASENIPEEEDMA